MRLCFISITVCVCKWPVVAVVRLINGRANLEIGQTLNQLVVAVLQCDKMMRGCMNMFYTIPTLNDG